jgi:predicted metal-dependent HD superfamily phosphohydrolase
MHDVVWSPDATEAEAASAAWARERLASRGVNAGLLDRMTELILATRHRASPPTSRDEALVRDLDLLVFAAPPEIFDRCTELIRREYGHLPDDAWRTGRARVLRAFLDPPVLYHSEPLAGLEAAARANLGRAVATLDIPYT